MTTPTLSSDQFDFANRLSEARTGLDSNVETAWIAAESGWGTTKKNHNYLNVGPGRSYSSAADAVADTVKVLHQPNMAGILAHPGDPAGQIAAIKASPWDASHYANGSLDGAYAIVKKDPIGVLGIDKGASGIPLDLVPQVAGQVAGQATSDVAAGLGSIFKFFGVGDVFGEALVIGLMIVFSIAALGIIALGLSKLTGAAPSEHLEQLGNAQTAATLATAAA